MIVWRDRAAIPAGFGPSAVAIGKFDGVHRGHQGVIARLRQDAAASGARPVAVTFDRNPLSLLRPDRCPESIVTLPRKLELLGALGLDATLVLTFDAELAARSAADFVGDTLVAGLGATTVLVGKDFRFGRGGEGDVALLQKLGRQSGFAVDVIDDVVLSASGRRVSSSWVREMLARGDVEGAAAALGRLFDVRALVVPGLRRGRELGFPTANLAAVSDVLIPADGVYAGWLQDHDTGIRHPAAVSVGINPTFDDVHRRQVEAHVLDRTDLDLYGHDVTVAFAHRLRGMTAFSGVPDLIAQIGDDVSAARRMLGDADAVRSDAPML